METFADYILSEENLIKKMEIVYYLQKREKIFFDNSVVLKAEIVRLFIDTMKLDVDKNLVFTACLLYAVKKNTMSHDLDELKKYAQEGAKYLKTLGFSERFCKICSEVNRYAGDENRENESDILELADQFRRTCN